MAYTPKPGDVVKVVQQRWETPDWPVGKVFTVIPVWLRVEEGGTGFVAGYRDWCVEVAPATPDEEAAYRLTGHL